MGQGVGGRVSQSNGHTVELVHNGSTKRHVSLRVLGRFELTVGGRPVSLGLTSQRLLALLAIRSGQLPRTQAAGVLWPETSMARATANLRSTLWRIQQNCSGVLEASFYDLRLAPDVTLDIQQSSDVAHRLLDQSAELSVSELKRAMQCNLHDDLLPDIEEHDWLTAERERFRQLRVHALESLARHTLAANWHGAAVEAALGAIRADPFRESAHQLLIKAHLAEGSQLEARRYYFAYCELLRKELGLTPSSEFMAILGKKCHTKLRSGAPGSYG